MRRLLTAIGAALILLLAPSAIKGQSSGKIIGRVTDSSTGGPLIGANVLVDGTLLGGASDQEGRYLILKVPPGRYQLTATYIGHQRMVVTDVQVLTDLTTGVEYQSDEIRFENYTLIPEKNDNGQEIEPFQPVIVPISQLNHNRYLRSPEKLSVYLQDKIEYESVVINVGLRYDLFDPHGQLPADPEDPNIYQPFKLEHKYHDLDNSGAIDLAEQVPENEYSLEELPEMKAQSSHTFQLGMPGR